VSGSSTHADRVATIRRVWKDHGVMIDPPPPTRQGRARAPGSGRAARVHGDAQPAKFAETIREALGRDPERPVGFENLEKLPQRVEVMDANAATVKRHIERHAA